MCLKFYEHFNFEICACPCNRRKQSNGKCKFDFYLHHCLACRLQNMLHASLFDLRFGNTYI